MRCGHPQLLKVVRFVEDSLSFNHLNISCADIPCVLESDGGEAARSTHPVTLYIKVNITPLIQYDSLPSIPTKDDYSPAEEATIPGRIQFPVPEHVLPLSHHKPVETGNTMLQSWKEMSPTGTENPRFALHRADESVKRIVSSDRSNTWERAAWRIKWMMHTLSPIAEVRVNALLMFLVELTSTLSFPLSQRWRTVYF